MKNLYKLLSFGCVIFLLFGFASTKTFALTGPENPFSFSAAPGNQPGTVTVTWYDDGSASHYNLLYGTDPNHYNYGVVGLPDTQNVSNSSTINDLTPGQWYYFTLIGITGSIPKYAGPVAVQVPTSASESTSAITNHLPEYGFTAQPGATAGTVLLSWNDNDSADKYDIVYGKTPGSLVYGVENVPFTQNVENYYPVGALQSGQAYYFSLIAERNGSIVLWSNPVSAIAK